MPSRLGSKSPAPRRFRLRVEKLGAPHRGMRRYSGLVFWLRRHGGEQIPGFKRGDFGLPAGVKRGASDYCGLKAVVRESGGLLDPPILKTSRSPRSSGKLKSRSKPPRFRFFKDRSSCQPRGDCRFSVCSPVPRLAAFL